MVGNGYQRFLASTRGRLIALLRRDSRTVDELAAQLELTDNAVRAHLATLERDGLVRPSGVRRNGGVGKPATSYSLTPEAERLFPHPYAALLDGMLSTLGERLAPEQVEAILLEAGRRLAARSDAAPAASRDRQPLRLRLAAAADALNQVGGLDEVEERDGTLSIRGYSCALGALAPTHPEVCRLAAAFVSEVAGTPMRDCCELTGAVAHCCFAPISDQPDQPDQPDQRDASASTASKPA